MAVLSSVPEIVDLEGYGGDTLTFTVTAPTALIGGREWSGQVRAATSSTAIDATFLIQPPTETDGPAHVSLLAADTRRLVEESGVVIQRVRRLQPKATTYIAQYKGVWDVQVAMPGEVDHVTTLARGAITIELDVTREVVP